MNANITTTAKHKYKHLCWHAFFISYRSKKKTNLECRTHRNPGKNLALYSETKKHRSIKLKFSCFGVDLLVGLHDYADFCRSFG